MKIKNGSRIRNKTTSTSRLSADEIENRNNKVLPFSDTEIESCVCYIARCALPMLHISNTQLRYD